MSHKSLSVLLNHIGILTSPKSKVKEKKESIESIIQCISSKNIQDILDQNTNQTLSQEYDNSLISNTITWKSIIVPIVEYIKGEISRSKSSMNLNIKDIISKFRKILQIIDSRGPILHSSCEKLLNHFIFVLSLESKEFIEELMNDYHHIIEETLLSHDIYWRWVTIKAHIKFIILISKNLIQNGNIQRNVHLFCSIVKNLPFSQILEDEILNEFVDKVLINDITSLLESSSKKVVKELFNCLNYIFIEWFPNHINKLSGSTALLNKLTTNRILNAIGPIHEIVQNFRIQLSMTMNDQSDLCLINEETELYEYLISKISAVESLTVSLQSDIYKINYESLCFYDLLSDLIVRQHNLKIDTHKLDTKRRKKQDIREKIIEEAFTSLSKANIYWVKLLCILITKHPNFFELDMINDIFNQYQTFNTKDDALDIWFLLTLMTIINNINRISFDSSDQIEKLIVCLWNVLLQKINHPNIIVANLSFKIMRIILTLDMLDVNQIDKHINTILNSNAFTNNGTVIMVEFLNEFLKVSQHNQKNIQFDEMKVTSSKLINHLIKNSIETLKIDKNIIEFLTNILRGDEFCYVSESTDSIILDIDTKDRFNGLLSKEFLFLIDVFIIEDRENAYKFEANLESIKQCFHDYPSYNQSDINIEKRKNFISSHLQYDDLITMLVDISNELMTKRKQDPWTLSKLLFIVSLLENIPFPDELLKKLSIILNFVDKRVKLLENDESSCILFTDIFELRTIIYSKSQTIGQLKINTFANEIKGILKKFYLDTKAEDDFFDIEMETQTKLSITLFREWLRLVRCIMRIDSSLQDDFASIIGEILKKYKEAQLDVIEFIINKSLVIPKYIEEYMTNIIVSSVKMIKKYNTQDQLRIINIIASLPNYIDARMIDHDESIHKYIDIIPPLIEFQHLFDWRLRKALSNCLYQFFNYYSDVMKHENEFITTMYNYLYDNDIRVRNYITHNFLETLLLKNVYDYNQIRSKNNEYILNNSCIEAYFTMAYSLGIMLKLIPESSFDILKDFISFNIPMKLINQAIHTIVSQLGYTSIKHLIESHLKSLLFTWITEYKKDIDAFPFYLLNCDKKGFYLSYHVLILPILFYFNMEEEIIKTVKYMQSFNVDCLKSSFSSIFATTYPHVFQNKSKLESWKRLMTKFYPNFEKVMNENQLAIKIKLLENITNENIKEKNLPLLLEFDIIQKLIKVLSKDLEKPFSSSEISFTIIYLNGLIEQSVSTKNKSRTSHILEKFIDFILNNQTQYPNLRDILYTLIRCLKHHDIRDNILKYLYTFCDKLLQMKLADVLGKHLNIIVNVLIELIYEDEKSCHHAKSILKLIIQDNEELDQYIRNLPTLPTLPVLKGIFTKYDSLRANISFQEEIDTFIEHFENKQSQTVTRISSLEHLYSKLREFYSEINENDQNNKLKESMSKLIWVLVSMCALYQDEKTRILVSKCLGEIGVTQYMPSNYTDSIYSSMNRYMYTNSDAVELLLEFLSDFLTSMDIQVVQVATRCIHDILHLTEGKRVIERIKIKNNQLFEKVKLYIADLPFNIMLGEDQYDDLDYNQNFDVINIWSPINKPFNQWITTLTCHLCYTSNQRIWRMCTSLCKINAQFSEFCFPKLLEYQEPNSLARDLMSLMKKIVENDDNNIAPESIRLIVYSMVHLRHINLFGNDTSNQIFWEKISLDVSQASKKCSAYFSSLYFLEYAYGDHDSFTNMKENEKKTIISLLLDIYTNVDEPDSIYAIENFLMMINEQDDDLHLQSSLRIGEHESNWLKCIDALEVLLEKKQNKHLHYKMLRSLWQLGQHHLYRTYLNGMQMNKDEYPRLSEYQYQDAWRNTKWDLPIVSNEYNSNSLDVHQAIYTCMYLTQQQDYTKFSDELKNIRLNIIESIGTSSFESNQSLLPKLAYMQIFSDIEMIHNVKYLQQKDQSLFTRPSNLKLRQSQSFSIHQDVDPIKKWNMSVKMMMKHTDMFEEIETVLASRLSLLKLLDETSFIENSVNFWRIFSKIARKAKRYQFSRRFIHKNRQFYDDSISPSFEIEHAKLLWNMGEQDKAISISKALSASLMKGIKTDVMNKSILGDVLRLTGKWLAFSKSENTKVIIEEYLQKSIEMYSTSNLTKRCKSHFELARFADLQYRELIEKSKSPEWITSENYKQKKLSDMKDMELARSRTRSKEEERLLNKHVMKLKRSIQEADNEVKTLQNQIRNYLEIALENYIQCLLNGEKHDIISIFRVISLWFANTTDQNVQYIISKHINQINPKKFLPLFYQIASRISTQGVFKKLLDKIILKVAMDYPHHSLFQLFALLNGTDSDKLSASEQILNTLKQRSNQMSKIIDQYNLLIQSFIEVSELKVDKHSTGGNFSTRMKIMHLSNLIIPVPTCNFSPDQLSQPPTIHRFERTYKLAGGLNLPKIIVCVGSDGNRYTQLVKENDDLRQDAVMIQVFNLINTLLQSNPETSRRQLKIRTYKTIPLSHKSGVLEWVNNTITLGDYLVGKTANSIKESAHARYRPNDWPSLECRKKLDMSTNRYEMYMQITENFKPVFHYFFIENYYNPSQWFERRLNYTRSVATSSMVGYILGLGDRHAFNILIDKYTAEVIHIDLGVAFDQGKVLTIPELVPFRLTRDIVDGMGMNKVEGVFTRCCEHTMRVLRDKYELLMTIVEVFLHDPLYRWTLSPMKAMNIQRDENEYISGDTSKSGLDDTRTADAEYILHRFKRKLLGHEDGGVLSVEGQVKHLINQAQDPERLCRMFSGWGAWI